MTLAPLIAGQGLHFLVVLAFYALDVPTTMVLVLSGAATTLLYGRYLTRWLKRGVQLVSPVTIYVASGLLRMGPAIVYMGFALPLIRDDRRYLPIVAIGTEFPIHHMTEGLLILLLGEVGILTGLHMSQRQRPGTALNRSASARWRVGLFGFCISIALMALARMGAPIAVLGRFGPLILDFAAPAGIFLMLNAGISLSRGRWLHHAMLVPLGLLAILAAVSMSSYMKKSVVVALLPLMLFALYNPRAIVGSISAKEVFGLKHILLGSLTLAFFISFIFAYAELRRPDFYQGTTGNVTLKAERPPVLPYMEGAILGSIPGTDEFAKTHDFPDKGIWYFMRRISHPDEAGWAYERVQWHGWRHGNVLYDFMTTITPRIFWPSKPEIYWGRELAVLVGAAPTAEEATTSFGLPMAGAYYWIGGWGFVLGGMLVSGFMLGLTWRLFAPHFGQNLLATIVGMALMVMALSWLEGEFFGAMEHFVYFLILYPIMHLTGPLLKPRASASRTRMRRA